MNWKLRFKNKVTLTAIVVAGIALVYNTCGLIGVTIPVSQEAIVNWAIEVIGFLLLLGVLVDPTTEGIKDSEAAMQYEEPK